MRTFITGRCANRTGRTPAGVRVSQVLLVLCVGMLAATRADAAARFQSTPVTTAFEGQEYVYDIVATGVGNVTVSAPNGLPPWLSLSRIASGIYVLSGTPSDGDSGAGIVLRAVDGDRSLGCVFFPASCIDTQTFDISIVRNQPPVVVPPGIPDQTASQGQPFTLEVSGHFEDPDGDPLSFTATGLPSSLSISAGGRISGTPRTADVRNSPFDVVVRARDGRGGEASDAFMLSVHPAARADLVLESIDLSPVAALVDETMEWTFTVRNAGPSQSATLELEVGFAANPFTLTDRPASCSSTADDADGSLRTRCMIDPLDAQESATIRLSGFAGEPGDVFVTASVVTSDLALPDPNPDNNSAATSASVATALATDAAQSLSGLFGLAAAAADLNGDDFDDLVVATTSEDPPAVHLNVEDPASLHPTLRGPDDSRRGLATMPLSPGDAEPNESVALVDLDDDGHLDAVLANGPGFASSVYWNPGDGGLSDPQAIGAAADDSRAVAAGDLSGNGLADLVFANVGPNRVYLNQGAGDFALAPPLDGGSGLYSRDVLVGNLLGNTLPDIVVANDDGPAHLYRNLGGGTFAEPVIIDPGPTSSVAAGDFNGDGRIDLVFGRDAPGPSGLPSNPVYLNDGAGGFALATELGAAHTRDVLTADLTGNGALDLIFINASGTHQIYAGDGNGDFSLHPRQFVSMDAGGAATGRFGRDRRLGVAVSGLGGTDVFFNDGHGNLGLGVTTRPVIELVGAAQVALEVGDTYEDPGAIALDAEGEELTPAVDNPVNTALVGTYAVTYTAMDKSGNAAVPVQRTVRVDARSDASGGGGGAAGYGLLAMLIAALWLRSHGAVATCASAGTTRRRRAGAAGA